MTRFLVLLVLAAALALPVAGTLIIAGASS